MLGSNIGEQFVAPVKMIGNALARIAHELHTANQLKWLEIRQQKGTGAFAAADTDVIIQVGRRIGATTDERG